MIDRNFIRINDLATYLNISKVTVWRWRKEGRLPAAHAISPKIVGWKLARRTNNRATVLRGVSE
ncbi:helix-turn-helix transcriptional regulator [Vibrio parahaemolyticus]|uniref:helix-turn-helix transcriptional regulator n=1 Tax=Vibrio parahaemolyticus TaxID=670 RepID=UPI0008130DA1|nr:helix-turn-helix domain-containing protein [Vibrio parahaemolyticus]MBE5175426.1 helix-turn-helix domain-containing protein [Vibrio parahaemolyticus]OCP61233.1 transcriptional regulator [Vibrio parahaemolyticus]HCE4546787.1 helix-turn-helix domain-containing protein [Vibrio parahaemolyticus]